VRTELQGRRAETNHRHEPVRQAPCRYGAAQHIYQSINLSIYLSIYLSIVICGATIYSLSPLMDCRRKHTAITARYRSVRACSYIVVAVFQGVYLLIIRLIARPPPLHPSITCGT